MLKIENPIKKRTAEVINLLLFLVFLPFTFRKKKSLPESPIKILILRLDHIGDVVMATGVYKHIKNRFPKCKISVMTGRWGTDILEGNPYIDEIIIHSCPWWKKVRKEKAGYLKWLFGELPPLIKKIRGESFDIGIDLRGDFRHILFVLFLGKVKYKISYNRSGGEYLLERAADYNLNLHEIEKNFKLLEAIGIKNIPTEEKSPQIFLFEKEKIEAKKIFEATNIPKNSLKIIMHPGAGNKSRIWGHKNFASFINHISEKYSVSVFLIGDRKEYRICEAIKQLSGENVYNTAGVMKIRESAALIEQGDMFIGNDSSMGHIAASFGVPSLILLGPTTPERCKPYNKRLTCIYHKFPCSPCLQNRCVLTGTEQGECMESIKVEEVALLFEKIVQEQINRYNKTQEGEV